MVLKTIEEFIIQARTQTYAGNAGKVTPALEGSTQLEYREGDWLYRDVYYTGQNTFYGMETIFYENKALFGLSYYGNWGTMTEIEIDLILRGALLANPKTRLYYPIEWQKEGYLYACIPSSTTGLNEIGGTETISKNGKEVYVFYYAGSVLTPLDMS